MLFRLGILLVLLGICLFIVLRIVKQVALLRRPPAASATDALVQDPVCLTYLPQRTAVAAHGTHFCSARCADAYARQQTQKG